MDGGWGPGAEKATGFDMNAGGKDIPLSFPPTQNRVEMIETLRVSTFPLGFATPISSDYSLMYKISSDFIHSVTNRYIAALLFVPFRRHKLCQRNHVAGDTHAATVFLFFLYHLSRRLLAASDIREHSLPAVVVLLQPLTHPKCRLQVLLCTPEMSEKHW